MLHVAEPIIAPKQEEYVLDCIKKNWLSWKGEYVEKFEEAFAKKVGANYAVMVSSGTAALEIAYQIALLNDYTKLVVPNFSFIATLSAAIRAGFKDLTIADIELSDLGITKDTKYVGVGSATAICIVPISGLIDWQGRVRNSEHFYIIDAAQALGTKIPFDMVSCATYSFFANKFISTGEGGMIATNNASLASQVRQLRSLPSFEYLAETTYPKFGPQTNSRPTNIQAAIGLAQLEVLPEKLEAHKKVYNWYKEAYENTNLKDHLAIQYSNDNTQIPWVTRFRIIPKAGGREHRVITGRVFVDNLAKSSIEAKPFYTPFTEHPLTQEYLTAKQTLNFLPKSVLLQGFYVPTHQNVTEQDVEKIIKTLKSIIEEYRL